MSTPWYQMPIGHGYITSYQGPNTDSPHWAEDVETPFHTPITSLVSGTVKTSDYKPWGGEVFVEPDAGGPEVYMYHLDLLNVGAGQHVAQGQVLGLSGGENPGYPGALHPTQPQFSTGPHTHVGYFEKYVSTPIGTEPFGPDVLPLLRSQGMAPPTGQILSSTGQQQFAASQQPCGPFDILCQIQQAATGAVTPAVNTGVDILYRLGFVLIGLLFVYLGLKHFLGPGQQINIQIPGSGNKQESATQ